MLYKKPIFPEVGEITLCTVKKILYHSVFVSLDEYANKEGLIHISEVSPGRIRNLRDFVKEGKKIVCKVLRIDQRKGHVDLSLRRVSASMRKKKNEEFKQEQKAEKLLELVAKTLKTTLEEMYKKAGYAIIEKYGSLALGFQDISQNPSIIKSLELDKKIEEILASTIKEKIKPPEVRISKNISITSSAPNGIDIIKSTLIKTKELAKKNNYKVSVKYMSAPLYKIDLISDNYKNAEVIIKSLTEFVIKEIKNQGGIAEIKEK